MSYGPDVVALIAHAADIVDKILKGRTPRSCRSNSQPSSNLSSISRLQKLSVWRCQNPLFCSQTRWLNRGESVVGRFC